ncbi:MAG: magnesium transporter MgtE [Holophagae bacterium]|nr:MAG: magnesium transporter MgtE [Holophagae bacterium]
MTDHMQQPIMTVARTDVATLHEAFTVQQALDDIRSRGLGERIVYFYVVDADGALVGVVPTRRLLIAPLEQRLSEVMIRRVVTISAEATVLDALEAFAIHRLLAFPVVDRHRRILGVVDVGLFSDEVFDLTERERMGEVFEAIGFRVSQVRDVSPLRAFRFRFPWLTATIASGTVCALLVSAFEVTLAQALVLAFFLTLVLGLGESVSIQSMTVAIHALRSTRPTLRWYVSAFRRELGTALLLGAACGLTVGAVVWLWRGAAVEAVAIGSSLVLTLAAASLFGLSVPTLLHALRLDPKIAAGPVTLALADVCTIVIYFMLATALLR